MKYSFMTFSTPKLTFEEVIKVAQDLGYDGVEPRMDSNQAHGVELDATAEQRADFKKQAEDAGVALCCLATSMNYVDPAVEGQRIDETHERIDLAADCGIPRLRVFGGGLVEGMSRESSHEQLVKCLKKVADHAGEKNVTLCVETHDSWCDPAQVRAVIDEVDSPNVAANWDIMHPVRMGFATMAQAFEILNGVIQHVHCHDGRNKPDGGIEMLPIGQGVIDHRTAVQALQQAGYEGFISGEWINWKPWEDHLGSELAALKKLEQ